MQMKGMVTDVVTLAPGARRATCDECKRRRMCNTIHVRFVTWVVGKPYRRTEAAIDMGDLCEECADKVRREVL